MAAMDLRIGLHRGFIPLSCAFIGAACTFPGRYFSVLPPMLFIVAALMAGVFVGPAFPAMLSSCLDWKLGTSRMGIVLAACAVGAAVLPLMVGKAAEAWSLRWAMLLPLAAIAGLVATSWLPPAGLRRGAALEEVAA